MTPSLPSSLDRQSWCDHAPGHLEQSSGQQLGAPLVAQARHALFEYWNIRRYQKCNDHNMIME
jgi:hypothetical protein